MTAVIALSLRQPWNGAVSHDGGDRSQFAATMEWSNFAMLAVAMAMD